jgi:hypothetical protein
MREPPKLATALLKLLGPQDHALMGDLAENYASGKSGWWYWRQILMAVASEALQDARRNPARIVVSATVAVLCAWFATRGLSCILGFDQWLFETGVNRWLYINGYGLPLWSRDLPLLAIWKALSYGLSAYVIGRMVPRIVVPFVSALIAVNGMIFVADCITPNTYSLAHLIATLVVLYPTAALIGGFAALQTHRLRRATSC